jgi:hypothetical protein
MRYRPDLLLEKVFVAEYPADFSAHIILIANTLKIRFYKSPLTNIYSLCEK